MVSVADEIKRSFEDVKAWGRNAKVLVTTEIFWGIPMTWIFFYRPIFMKELGVNEILIGYSMSLPLFCQMVLPMLGGYLADRFGRKRVLMLFDSIGWIGSPAIWLIATEFWQMILAISLEGLTATIYGVWQTCLVEDTEPPYRASIFSFMRLIYIVAGLLTPIAGLVIALYGVVQGYRYILSGVMIITIPYFILLQMLLRESEIGKILSSSHEKRSSQAGGYLEVLKMVAKHKQLLILFALTIVAGISTNLITTFKPLFLTDLRALALDKSAVSIIPMASSITSLVCLLFIVPRLKYQHFRNALLFSYAAGFLGLPTIPSIRIMCEAPIGFLIKKYIFMFLILSREA